MTPPNILLLITDQQRRFYFDPAGRATTEHEMYDLEDDPNEQLNLVDRLSDAATRRVHRNARRRLGEHLDELMEGSGTGPPSADRVDGFRRRARGPS